jgi:hypothetical protein
MTATRAWRVGCILALMSAAPVGATGVVAFRTPGRVVLGADSALTGFDAAGDVALKTNGCKVGRAGPWAYVWGGHEAGGTDIDLSETFARAIAHTDTLAALTRAVRSFIARRILTLDWPALRAIYPPGSAVVWMGIGRMHGATAELGISGGTGAVVFSGAYLFDDDFAGTGTRHLCADSTGKIIICP